MTKTLYEPLGGNKMPRFAGPSTMMRLPTLPSAKGLDACFVGDDLHARRFEARAGGQHD